MNDMDRARLTYNSLMAAEQTRLQRLDAVLNEYQAYRRNCQLDLADASIVWAFAALARHPNVEVCKSHFYAHVDEMYADSDAAKQQIGEGKRKELARAAHDRWVGSIPQMQDILRGSVQTLWDLKPDAPIRVTAEFLRLVRGPYLEHASALDLPEFIAACVLLCSAREDQRLGRGEAVIELMNAMERITSAAERLGKNIEDAIKSGKLQVRDGKIVDPNQD